VATMESDTVALSILIVGEASGVFAGFCPSWFTVSSPFFHEQDAHEGNIRRIRWGEIAATSIVVSTGFAVTHVSGSKVPLVVSIGISALFVAGYEYMIAHPATEDGAGDGSQYLGSMHDGEYALSFGSDIALAA
jgi:hypothetical protein